MAETTPVRDPDDAEVELGTALDSLDEKVKLLLARHAELAARCAEAERAAEKHAGLDPIALEERVEELVAENDRLARHASFLEERIKGLYTRVRYVMET